MGRPMRERIESLFHACEAGDLEKVKQILAEGNHDADGNNRWQVDIDPRGWQRSPLHLAIVGGHLPLAEWLLQNGADPNPRTKYGDTPLNVLLEPPVPAHWMDAARLLLAHGADPAIPNDEDETPIGRARRIPALWERIGPLFEQREKGNPR